LRPIQFDLSLYAGHKGKHEEITRMPGSWERTVAAARRLLARKMAVLLKAPVMETNVDDVAGMAELATEMGAEFTFEYPKITAIETGDQAPLELRMKAETLARFYRTTMAGHLERTFIGPESMKAKGEELRPAAPRAVPRRPAVGVDLAQRRRLAVQRAADAVRQTCASSRSPRSGRARPSWRRCAA
jgi:MoaA/NifB/PqqE/SkfB family radical SAM enzyme